MKKIKIAKQWDLLVPEHRVKALDWDIWESERLVSIHENLVRDEVLFDIGAEQGDLTSLFATWGAKIVPFEPNPLFWPQIRSIYKANTKKSKILGSFAGFVANKDILNPQYIEETFLLPEKDGWAGCSFLEEVQTYDFRNVLERHHDTPSIKIDTFVKTKKIIPNILNIDVEGAELEVLRSAKETITKYKPKIWVSVHPEMLANDYRCTKDDLLKHMESLGYSYELLAVDHEHHYAMFPKEKA